MELAVVLGGSPGIVMLVGVCVRRRVNEVGSEDLMRQFVGRGSSYASTEAFDNH